MEIRRKEVGVAREQTPKKETNARGRGRRAICEKTPWGEMVQEVGGSGLPVKNALAGVISPACIRLVCGCSVGAGVDRWTDQEKHLARTGGRHVPTLGVALSPPKSLPVV